MPKKYLRYFKDMLYICPIYGWDKAEKYLYILEIFLAWERPKNKPYIDMPDKCLIYLWDIYRKYLRNTQYILEIHLRYVVRYAWVRYTWETPKIYVIYTWDKSLIFPRYTRDIPYIYAWDLLKVCLWFIFSTPDIYSKYNWDKLGLSCAKLSTA